MTNFVKRIVLKWLSALSLHRRSSGGGMKAEKIGCREVVDLLADYLDGELSSEIVKGLEEHLSGCDSCTAFLNTYRQTIALSEKLKYGDIPPELRRRLRDFLREKM